MKLYRLYGAYNQDWDLGSDLNLSAVRNFLDQSLQNESMVVRVSPHSITMSASPYAVATFYLQLAL